MAGPAIKTSAIDHVVLHVRDVAAATAFYRDVLGLRVRSSGEGYAFLHCGEGGQQIGLFATGEGEPLRPGDDLNHLAFAVPSGSYEALKAALEARGIAVRGRSGDPHCIYFDDPDGHCLQIVVPKWD